MHAKREKLAEHKKERMHEKKEAAERKRSSSSSSDTKATKKQAKTKEMATRARGKSSDSSSNEKGNSKEKEVKTVADVQSGSESESKGQKAQISKAIVVERGKAEEKKADKSEGGSVSLSDSENDIAGRDNSMVVQQDRRSGSTNNVSSVAKRKYDKLTMVPGAQSESASESRATTAKTPKCGASATGPRQE